MSFEASVARRAIAMASLAISGREDDLLPPLPEEQRKHLFCCRAPEGSESPFDPEVLSELLRKEGIPVGVDFDRDSRFFGVRYVSHQTPLPPSIARFSSRGARESWGAWQEEQREMTAAVAEMAKRVRAGQALSPVVSGRTLENNERG